MGTTRNGGEHRQATDSSLRDERARTDHAIEEREARADAVQADQRARTDAATRASRGETDARSEDLGAAAKAAVAAERLREDEALARERTAEDRAMQEDRVALKDLVARLFAAERAATDEHLAGERAWADELMQLRFDYLAMIGHDLGSMIAGVNLEGELLRRSFAGGAPPNRALSGAQRILRMTRRMQRLAADLVDVASVSQGTLRVLRRPVDLAPAIATSVDEYEGEAQGRNVALGLELPHEPLEVHADPERIQQVLGNLVGNALKFTPASGTVTVRASRENDGIRVAVSDTGLGIPPDKLERVFDRYVRLASGERGAGLGLFIARSLIEAHGGRLWAESGPGGGSTLVFTLPVAP